jgi:hypothetical protein
VKNDRGCGAEYIGKRVQSWIIFADAGRLIPLVILIVTFKAEG